MTVSCISYDMNMKDKIIKILRKKANEKHMDFLIFTNEENFMEQKALQKIENSYIIFDDFGSLVPSDSVIDFFGKSGNNNIIYFEDFLKHPTIYAMTDIFMVASHSKEGIHLCCYQNPLWINMINKKLFIRCYSFDENCNEIKNCIKKDVNKTVKMEE